MRSSHPPPVKRNADTASPKVYTLLVAGECMAASVITSALDLENSAARSLYYAEIQSCLEYGDGFHPVISQHGSGERARIRLSLVLATPTETRHSPAGPETQASRGTTQHTKAG